MKEKKEIHDHRIRMVITVVSIITSMTIENRAL